MTRAQASCLNRTARKLEAWLTRLFPYLAAGAAFALCCLSLP